MRFQKLAKISFAVTLVFMLGSGSASAASPQQEVQTSLQQLNAWLGSSAAAQGWQRFLQLDRLSAELAKGNEADEAAVSEILAKFESGAAGLNRPQFVATRNALRVWLAELQLPEADELPEFARSLASEYKPISDDQVAAAKNRLRAAVDRLNRYLPPRSRNAAAWRKHLKLDELNAQVQPDAAPELKTLVAQYHLYSANTPGLERKEFSDVAAALLNYIDLVAVRGIEDAQAQYEQQLEDLATNLEKYQGKPSEDVSFSIGRRLGELSVGRQAQALVAAVRRHFSHPNLYAEISQPLIEAGLARPVDRMVDVRDNILGASIYGNGRMRGAVTLELVPSQDRAIMETVLKGHVHTNTTGNKSGVTFYSRGVTGFHARKRVVMTENGLQSQHARTNAVTNNNVYDLSAGPLISNAAWGQVNANRAQGNYIAARHAETRISNTFEREAAPMLVQAAQRFQEKFRNPLLRMREFPELLNFSTTNRELQVVGLKANRFQIGAPQAPPTFNERHDIAVRVHESFPSNMASALLGGRTFNDEQMKKQIIAMRGSLPEEMQNDEDEEPWSITFARHKPVTMLFDDQSVEITIRGQQYTSGDREFRAMNVSATYKFELTPDGSRLVRQGNVKIEPPDFAIKPRQLSASEVALKTILEKKFAKVFKEEIVSDGLELPGAWEKVGKLRPAELVSADGWLMVGWRMPTTRQVNVAPPQRSAR